MTGEETQFTVTFTTPFDLPPGHYFFVPQVYERRAESSVAVGPEADRSPPGTPFPPGFTDPQSWIPE